MQSENACSNKCSENFPTPNSPASQALASLRQNKPLAFARSGAPFFRRMLFVRREAARSAGSEHPSRECRHCLPVRVQRGTFCRLLTLLCDGLPIHGGQTPKKRGGKSAKVAQLPTHRLARERLRAQVAF
jgi:hypothetical protein